MTSEGCLKNKKKTSLDHSLQLCAGTAEEFFCLFLPIFHWSSLSQSRCHHASAYLLATHWLVSMDQTPARVFAAWKQPCLFASCHVLTTVKCQFLRDQNLPELLILLTSAGSFHCALQHLTKILILYWHLYFFLQLWGDVSFLFFS